MFAFSKSINTTQQLWLFSRSDPPDVSAPTDYANEAAGARKQLAQTTGLSTRSRFRCDERRLSSSRRKVFLLEKQIQDNI